MMKEVRKKLLLGGLEGRELDGRRKEGIFWGVENVQSLIWGGG